VTGDPGRGPESAPQPDHDPDATQAWIHTPDDEQPIAPIETAGPQWSAESLLPMSDVHPDVDVPRPAQPAAPAEPSALDLLFAEDRFEDVESFSATPRAGTASPAVGTALAVTGDEATEPPKPPRPPMTEAQRQRMLLIGAAAAVGILVLAALFLLGTRLPALVGEAAVDVTAAPAPSLGIPLTPVDPGVYPWNELRGGECLEPFTDPWAEQFTVVDCLEPHTAQLTLHGSYLDALGTVNDAGELVLPAFPGEESLVASIDALCAVGVDFALARDITDGQIQGTFPTTVEEWDADPSYRCYFSRSSGAELTGSVAVS